MHPTELTVNYTDKQSSRSKESADLVMHHLERTTSSQFLTVPEIDAQECSSHSWNSSAQDYDEIGYLREFTDLIPLDWSEASPWLIP